MRHLIFENFTEMFRFILVVEAGGILHRLEGGQDLHIWVASHYRHFQR